MYDTLSNGRRGTVHVLLIEIPSRSIAAHFLSICDQLNARFNAASFNTSTPLCCPGHFDDRIRRDDARHEKTDLKVFVVVIPKEGWARLARENPSFGMTLTFHNFFWYDTDFLEFDSVDIIKDI